MKLTDFFLMTLLFVWGLLLMIASILSFARGDIYIAIITLGTSIPVFAGGFQLLAEM